MELNLNDVAIHIATGSPDFDPHRQSLILVHGAANDRDAWRDLMPMLAAKWNVFAPDLPGHGMSGGAALTSIEAIADWLLSLIDALGLQQAALAGHSMGSLAALEAAARGGDRISHLSLLGAAVPMPVSSQLLETAGTHPDAACRMVTIWSHTPTFFLTGGGGHGVWGPGKTLAVMRRNSKTLASDLANCNNYLGGLEAAAAVTCPSLLLLGKRDRMTPLRAVQPLQDALKKAQRSEIADCGHAMMVEKPQEVATALIALPA
jgi:pimeloyl-ACP methyl ester carboxylesterase